jgi:hypothetical protein
MASTDFRIAPINIPHVYWIIFLIIRESRIPIRAASEFCWKYA